MTRRSLNLKKLLIAEAVLLIPIYIRHSAVVENHYAPSATMFTGLVPPWDYDPDGPQPVAALPAALTMVIAGGGYLLFLAVRRLFRWVTEVPKHLRHMRNRMKKHWSVGDRITLEPYGEGRVTEVLSGGLFLRVQWPMFDTPQLVTTAQLSKVQGEANE